MTKTVQKYEYAQFVPTNLVHNLLEWLYNLEAEGWKLCTEIQGKYYFYRLISIGVNEEWIEPK